MTNLRSSVVLLFIWMRDLIETREAESVLHLPPVACRYYLLLERQFLAKPWKTKNTIDAIQNVDRDRSEQFGGIVNNEEKWWQETNQDLQSWEIEGCGLSRDSNQLLCSNTRSNEQRAKERSPYFFQILLVCFVLLLRFFADLFRGRFLSCLFQLDLDRERSIGFLSNVSPYLQMFRQAVVRRGIRSTIVTVSETDADESHVQDGVSPRVIVRGELIEIDAGQRSWIHSACEQFDLDGATQIVFDFIQYSISLQRRSERKIQQNSTVVHSDSEGGEREREEVERNNMEKEARDEHRGTSISTEVMAGVRGEEVAWISFPLVDTGNCDLDRRIVGALFTVREVLPFVAAVRTFARFSSVDTPVSRFISARVLLRRMDSSHSASTSVRSSNVSRVPFNSSSWISWRYWA